MGKGKDDGPCCREGGSCGGTEVGGCCYAHPSGIGCASKSLQSVNLGLTTFFLLYPGIGFLILGLWFNSIGLLAGLAWGGIINFVAKLIMIAAIAAGMCCCTGPGCCGQIGSAVGTIVACVFSLIAVICAAVDHASFDEECAKWAGEGGSYSDCLSAKATMDTLFGIFYAGAIIPMILGCITAVVNFMHNSAIASGGGGGGKGVV